MTHIEQVKELIAQNGPISFHDYMELTGSHPVFEDNKPHAEIKTSAGTQYTNCDLTALFGETTARQLEEMWLMMGARTFTVAAYGTDSICRYLLDYLESNSKLYSRLNYYIVGDTDVLPEGVAVHAEVVKQVKSLDEIGTDINCVLSNNLLSNFAVHQVVMKDELMEVYVDCKNDVFTEVLKPASAKVKRCYKDMGILLPEGCRTELNIKAASWITKVAKKVKEGYVMTMDYGYPTFELYKTYDKQGVHVNYNKHKINDQLYNEQDKLAQYGHANLSVLHHWGAKQGLDIAGYTNKAHFLLSMGMKNKLVSHLEHNHNDIYQAYKKNNIALHKLLKETGNKFKLLIQHKGLPELQLTGLKMALPHAAGAALGATVFAGNYLQLV